MVVLEAILDGSLGRYSNHLDASKPLISKLLGPIQISYFCTVMLVNILNLHFIYVDLDNYFSLDLYLLN